MCLLQLSIRNKFSAMLEIFAQIFPFFALIALGYFAAHRGFFSDEATGMMTSFVFRFALPAMLFRFGSGLSLGEIFDGKFVLSYWLAGIVVYILALIVAKLRHVDKATTAVEAQCAVFGNSGFLAIPMMVGLLGERAIPSLMMILAVDIVFFGNLLIIIITVLREGYSSQIFVKVLKSLLSNPMVMSMALGLIYASLHLPLIPPVDRSLEILGSAATPCALFAIGAGLVGKSAERLSIALWLSFCKLVLHPLAAFVFAILILGVDRFSAGIMIGVAAMPTAGNIYIVARYYGIAPQRVSATILVSTIISVLSLTFVLGQVVNW